jgi:hypothetical protein
VAWCDNSKIAARSGSAMVPEWTMKAAAMAAPTTLAVSTSPQSRSTSRRQETSRVATSGRIVVIVFSVKSCIRPRMISRKPKL